MNNSDNNNDGETCGYVDSMLGVLSEAAEIKNELSAKLTRYEEAMQKLAAYTKQNRFNMAKTEIIANAREYNALSKKSQALGNLLDRVNRLVATALNNLRINAKHRDGAAAIPGNSKYFRNRKIARLKTV